MAEQEVREKVTTSSYEVLHGKCFACSMICVFVELCEMRDAMLAHVAYVTSHIFGLRSENGEEYLQQSFNDDYTFASRTRLPHARNTCTAAAAAASAAYH